MVERRSYIYLLKYLPWEAINDFTDWLKDLFSYASHGNRGRRQRPCAAAVFKICCYDCIRDNNDLPLPADGLWRRLRNGNGCKRFSNFEKKEAMSTFDQILLDAAILVIGWALGMQHFKMIVGDKVERLEHRVDRMMKRSKDREDVYNTLQKKLTDLKNDINVKNNQRP